MPTIRPATVDDVELILRFIEGLADYEHLRHACVATNAQLAATLFGPRPAAEVLLAFEGEDAAGFALFFPTYSTFLAKPGVWLEDLFVDPVHRGKGVGKALLCSLAALTLERDGGRLEWSVLDWNEPSIGFYRSLGAVGMNEWTTYRLTGDALGSVASLASLT